MLKENKVWTPNGYQVGPTNSLVGKGESIIDYTNGTGTLVTKGKVGVDNQPSSVRRDDSNVIAGNDTDWSNGRKFSEQVAPLTAQLQKYNKIENDMGKSAKLSSLSKQTVELQRSQLERAKAPILQAMKNITDRQEKQHQIEDYAAQYKANCGKDRFDGGKSFWRSYTTGGKGKVSNLMLDAGYMLPAMLETSMLNHWRRENPVMPNIYAANRYAPIALQTMASNRMSANPILENLYAQDRQAAYNLANAGGYTGGQRQANRTALALGNQRAIANALMGVQEKNIGYRNAYAEMAARLGDSEASRLQQANQYGWEAYNRAHGAKTKGIETHLANLGLIGQKWLSQRIKNKQYGDILDIYQQDVDNKNAALKALYGGNATPTNISNTKNTGLPTTTNKYNILNQYFTPDGFGGQKFSIINPYTYPSSTPTNQRIGKYGTAPDLLPTKASADRRRLAVVPNIFNNPTMTSAEMGQNPSRMMFNSNFWVPTTNYDPNGIVLYNTQKELDEANAINNELINATYADYMPGGRFYNQGASGVLFNNNDDRLPGFIMNKRNRKYIYTGGE